MENATKALIMAAGILIGVIVLSIFAYEFIVISNTGEQYGKEIKQHEIAEFNSQFEPYAYEYDGNKRKLKAQEVVTLLYLISDWNKNNESDQIEISFPNQMRSSYGAESNLEYGTIDNFNYEKFLSEKSVIIKNSETSYAIFTCSISSYDENGRIRKLSLNEIGKMIIDENGNETFKRI